MSSTQAFIWCLGGLEEVASGGTRRTDTSDGTVTHHIEVTTMWEPVSDPEGVRHIQDDDGSHILNHTFIMSLLWDFSRALKLLLVKCRTLEYGESASTAHWIFVPQE